MATAPFLHFAAEKLRVLKEKDDSSRKGSIDSHIIELVKYINVHSNYYTTSSCSGRILIFCESLNKRKEGTLWLLSSHDPVSQDDVMSVLRCQDMPRAQYIYFKFEPFILHVSCRTLEYAQIMLKVAVSSGFKNSGLSVSKKNKIIMSVRSTHTLQSPIAFDGKMIVSEEYMSHLVKISNEKLDENLQRITRFSEQLKDELIQTESVETLLSSKNNCHGSRIKGAMNEKGKWEEREEEADEDCEYLECFDQLFS